MARPAGRTSTKPKASARTARPGPRRRTAASRKAAGGRRSAGATAVLEEPRRTAARPVGKPRPVLKGVAKTRRARANGSAHEPSVPAAVEDLEVQLSDEEKIESAKYLPRNARPKRLFEEERFLFPESYGSNRVRLLVKDPEWLFAHWDVDQRTLATLRKDFGERAVALARLTLRLADPGHGGASVILLPPGVRGWYVRADRAPRSYRAELGLTLPSGEFRSLATSNTVTTPRVGQSQARARRRVHFRADAASVAAAGTPDRAADAPGPLPAARMDGGEDLGRAASKPGRKGTRRGGASDVYRR
jgi:hypothetical protein